MNGTARFQLAELYLRDFRCYRRVDIPLGSGVTVISGRNGQGKTSVLEAVTWIAKGASFRGAPDAALVRVGQDAAVVRAVILAGARTTRFEAEIVPMGRNRVRLNGKPVQCAQQRRGFLVVTVFAPDDLLLVKGGPAARRGYLDDLLTATVPRYAGVHADYERILRQRNALLRQGIRGADDTRTLEVFDAQLARVGAELALGRGRLVDRLMPLVVDAYKELAGEETVDGRYESTWLTESADPVGMDDACQALHVALLAARRHELARGVTLAGPHRDEWRLTIASLDSRVHASQGQQRTLALALRLGAHRLVEATAGTRPLLLLDDVFSELDDARADALLQHLGNAQTLVTSAGPLPRGLEPARVLVARDGHLVEG